MRDLLKKDYYGVLKLPPFSSNKVIRQRFKRLAKRLHPDVNSSPDAADKFNEVREAYEILTNIESRAIVDSWYAFQSQRGHHFTGPMFQESTPSEKSTSRPVPLCWTIGNDRTWSFGCFSLLAFFLTIIGCLSTTSATLTQILLVAIIVAVVIGAVAADGGERIREWLLWFLIRWWW